MFIKNDIILIRPSSAIKLMRNQTLHMPLGILYLADSLINSGYNVTIIDTDNKSALKMIKEIVSKNTLCFGISTMSGTQLANAAFIAKSLKSKYPTIPIIWGGVHVTALPEETLKSDLVDYIVWGEGENTVLDLLAAIKNNDIDSLYGMPGIGFKNGNELFIGENSGYTSLNKTFHLPYHLLDMDRYARELIIGAKREFNLWTSRGCPFSCKFCSNSSATWPNTKIRYHTIDHVVNEVRTFVKEYGSDMITFGDENFLMNEKRLIDLLSAIRKEDIFVNYRFLARMDTLCKLKEETWKFMKEHGVRAIITAPESGSTRILKYMNKGITLEQIYKADNLLTKFNFYKTYNILICTPQETKEDLKLTLKLILDLVSTSLQSPYPIALNPYIPLPGTELFQDAIRLGFKPPTRFNDWSKFDYENFSDSRNIVRPWISEEDLPFTEKAIYLGERLNYQLRGKETDVKAVHEVMQEIEQLIANG